MPRRRRLVPEKIPPKVMGLLFAWCEFGPSMRHSRAMWPEITRRWVLVGQVLVGYEEVCLIASTATPRVSDVEEFGWGFWGLAETDRAALEGLVANASKAWPPPGDEDEGGWRGFLELNGWREREYEEILKTAFFNLVMTCKDRSLIE